MEEGRDPQAGRPRARAHAPGRRRVIVTGLLDGLEEELIDAVHRHARRTSAPEARRRLTSRRCAPRERHISHHTWIGLVGALLVAGSSTAAAAPRPRRATRPLQSTVSGVQGMPRAVPRPTTRRRFPVF